MADSVFRAARARDRARASLVRGKKGANGRNRSICVLFGRVTRSLFRHSRPANALVWTARVDARHVPLDSRRHLSPCRMGACNLGASLASYALFPRSRGGVGEHDKRSGGSF
jgi:hypothetical protein